MKGLHMALALVLALTVALGSSGLAGGVSVVAKTKTKTVTRTFANDTSVAIPGAGTAGKASSYPLAIEVTGFRQGTIQDVNVTLKGLSHESPDDVDILLVAPDGKNAIILSEVGGEHPLSAVTITLDDQAARAMSPDPLVSGGAFQPTNLARNGGFDFFPDAPTPSGGHTLGTFAGGNPNGIWQLFVVDNRTTDTGALANGYELTIKAQVKSKSKGKGKGKHKKR